MLHRSQWYLLISAVAASLLSGCGKGYLVDDVPRPQASVQLPSAYTLVSQLGCAKQDVDLNTGKGTGGGAAHDDGPCINAALAAATPLHPVVLVQDGASLVSGIHGPATGNWSIYGKGGGFHADNTLFGTGFYQADGTNDDVIHNGPAGAGCPFGRSDPGFVPGAVMPARGSNIGLHNFVINGNRGDGTHGNSTTGDPHGSDICWYMGVNIMDMNDVVIDGIVFFNTSTYNLRFNDVGQSTVTNSIFANTGPDPRALVGQNGDGTHIDGPANDITIANNTYTTTDDAIALNAPEGWGGPITNITIQNSTVTQALAMVRMYTLSQGATATGRLPSVSNVSINNYSGQAGTCGSFGLEVARTMPRLNTISNVTWSNSTCTSDYGSLLEENIDDITFSNFTWNSLGLRLGFLNSVWVQSQVAHLTFNNVTIGSGASTTTALIETGPQKALTNPGSTVIQQVDINGLQSKSVVPYVADIVAPSAISVINAANIDWSDFHSLTNGGPIAAPVIAPAAQPSTSVQKTSP